MIGTSQPETTEVFAAMADQTRLKIIELLAMQDRCVCHLVEDLELGQSIVSHHVGVLRRSGLVTSYPHPRDRRWMYYRLNRDAIQELRSALTKLADEVDYNPEPLPCPIDVEDDPQ